MVSKSRRQRRMGNSQGQSFVLMAWPNACRTADFCLSVSFLERHPYREPWHQKEVAAPNTASGTFLGTTQGMPDLLWTWGLIR